MTNQNDQQPTPANMANLPHLAEALDDHRFRQFLDHVSFAVAVAEIGEEEVLVYGNIEFERLTGVPAKELEGKPWSVLPAGPELVTALLENEPIRGLMVEPWRLLAHDRYR